MIIAMYSFLFKYLIKYDEYYHSKLIILNDNQLTMSLQNINPQQLNMKVSVYFSLICGCIINCLTCCWITHYYCWKNYRSLKVESYSFGSNHIRFIWILNLKYKADNFTLSKNYLILPSSLLPRITYFSGNW